MEVDALAYVIREGNDIFDVTLGKEPGKLIQFTVKYGAISDRDG